MEFFGMGFGEILVVLLIGLLLFGPTKIANIGKTIGKTTREFKKAASDVTAQFNRELEEEKKEAEALKASISSASQGLPVSTHLPPADKPPHGG